MTTQCTHYSGMWVNVAKSKFTATECEYLGYVITREGIKPQTKEVAAIIMLEPPQSVTQLRGFLGIVQ